MDNQIYFQVICIISAILVPISATCDCDYPMQHYKDLGCKPVFAKPGDCCPKHYDCKEVFQRLASPDKCYFRGKEYKNRETIAEELIDPFCLAFCSCNKDRKEDFNCAHNDCPEFLGAFPLKPGCIRTYKQGQCCSSGIICPPFDNLFKCHVDGQAFYEGEKFYPAKAKCVNCVCMKGFAGKLEEPYCKKLTCSTELDTDKVKKNCAPVYFTQKGCCPIDWECQNGKYYDNIGKKLDNTLDNNSCRFGNRMLKIGEKFDIERKYRYSPEINCECRTPPFVTCLQQPHKKQ